MATPFVLPLELCHDPAVVGGKAAGLARLIMHGFPVPPGICLTTAAYQHALRQTGFDANDRWARLEQAPQADRQHMSVEYRQRLEALILPRSMTDALYAGVSHLDRELPTQGQCLWAVRSSATTEDGSRTSFAGVYRTLLGVPLEELPRAICACWASLWTETAFAYRQRATFKAPPSMAVVIQPLLTPMAAGVAYSRHPVTGRSDVVVVNAVWGLGEPLVSGVVTPDQYVMAVSAGDGSSAVRVIEHTIAQKRTRRVVTTAGVRDEPVPDEIQKEPAVREPDLRHLAMLTKRVEQMMDQPVDIEWAIDRMGLWLLQARPISTLPTTRGLTPEAYEWSRANFKETLPELPSPLGLSFLDEFMEDSILSHYRRLGCVIPPGVSSVRVIHGRPFINVTLFQSFVAQLGGNPALVTDQMGGQAHLPAELPPPLPWWKLARAGVLMMWKMRRAVTCAPAWFAEMKAMAAAAERAMLGTLAPHELLAWMDRLGQRLKERDLTFAIVAGVGQCLQALQYLLERWLGQDWRPLLNAALQGRGTVISALQILRVVELAEIARQEPTARTFFFAEPWQPDQYRVKLNGTRFLHACDAYLEEYGHRAIGESDLAVPRVAEQPEYVLGVIRVHVRTPPTRSVAEVQRQQAGARDGALREIRATLGRRRPSWIVFSYWYRRLCRYLALREANRHHLMYFLAAVRRLLFTLGTQWAAQGRIQSPEDIFLLTADEVRTAVADPDRAWTNVVSARRAERREQAEHTVPDFLSSVEEPALASNRPTENDRTLHGIPIGAGSAEGPVRRVLSPDDLAKVKPGDIMVTPVIDPGMAPLFSLAAGLVAEMGGMLSHGAIIAREYGLPTVANIRDVTCLLRDGERVVVDATRGEVRRCENGPAHTI